jgi:hypothetical protein
VRALARDRQKARRLPKDAEVIVGDLTRPETLAPAVEGLDAIVFTHGSDGGGKAGSKPVDYGGVRNVIAALTGRSVRVALMTAIGMTNREDDYNRQLAQVLVASLTSESALRKTFELVAVKGPAQHDLAPLFAALEADPLGGLDAVRDLANMPLPEEPQRVRDDLRAMKTTKAES